MLLQSVLALGTLLLPYTLANEELIRNSNTGVCSGMYSKEDWGGKDAAFINITLKSLDEKTRGMSFAIFEYQDINYIGKQVNGELKYICNAEAIELGQCDKDSEGEFMITDKVHNEETGEYETPKAKIEQFKMDELGLASTQYKVQKTGFYCVFTYTLAPKYEVVVDFHNAFGKLPAASINNLPLYGLLAVAYVVAMALYMFTVWKHKNELLPLQRYIMGFFVFLTIDTIFIWSYYDIRNEKGVTLGTNIFMFIVSFMNAAKIAFSFFLLQVVALGYGIVYPKLNRGLMRTVQSFTAAVFLFYVLFLVQTYVTNPESTSLWPLATILPVIVLSLIYYISILNALRNTLQYLREQRQMYKLQMYNDLMTIISISLVVVCAGSIVSTILILRMSTVEMIEQHWKTRFIMDFWPSFVYYGLFITIAFKWRPSDTSYMLACSQQLPTDPEAATDFDLDDLHSIGDEAFTSQVHDDDLNFSDDEQQHHRTEAPSYSAK